MSILPKTLTLGDDDAAEFVRLLIRLRVPFTHRFVPDDGHEFTGPLDRAWKIFTGEEAP